MPQQPTPVHRSAVRPRPPPGALTLPWLVRTCAWLLGRLPPAAIERRAVPLHFPDPATRRAAGGPSARCPQVRR